jgi:hypothetical protein
MPSKGKVVIAKPRGPWTAPETRKEKFEKLNAFVRSRNGWLVSVPGAETGMVEMLPDSSLAGEMRAAGYDLEPAGEGERIIAGSIIERLELSSSGAFVAATEGSTRPVYMRSHNGICRTRRYSFSLG